MMQSTAHDHLANTANPADPTTPANPADPTDPNNPANPTTPADPADTSHAAQAQLQAGPYFIETLAANGDVLHRHQVNRLPIRLGRGYDNDVILDDAYAGARHAVIDADDAGQLVLRDLGTRNGVIHKGKRVTALVVSGDTVMRLGHTSMRVRSPAYAVPPELHDRTKHDWEGVVPGLVGLLLIAVVALFNVWINDTQSFQLLRYLITLAKVVGAGVVWSGAWAFANRLFGRHVRLGRHLFILGCALLAVTVFRIVCNTIGYAFSAEGLTRYLAQADIVIIGTAVFFHLVTVKPQQARKLGIGCLVLTVLACGLTLSANEQRLGRLGDDAYMSVILPPAMRVRPNHSVDELLDDVAAKKAKLDVERAVTIKDDGGEDD